MENTKTSKKALRGLINDSMQEALSSLELPQPGKKAKKLLRNNSRKLASIFANVMKREEKKKRKAAKFMEKAVAGKSKKNKKSNGVAIEAEVLATA
jgi:predicted ATPase